jgi:hypothetical protein
MPGQVSLFSDLLSEGRKYLEHSAQKANQQGGLIIIDAALLAGKDGLNQPMLACLKQLHDKACTQIPSDKIKMIALARINPQGNVISEGPPVALEKLQHDKDHDALALSLITEIRTVESCHLEKHAPQDLLKSLGLLMQYNRSSTLFLSRDRSTIETIKLMKYPTIHIPELMCESDCDFSGFSSTMRKSQAPFTKIIFHIDIDDTLLLNEPTYRQHATFLNLHLLERMLELKKQYPQSEFHVATARPKWPDCHRHHPASVERVVEDTNRWAKGAFNLMVTPESYRGITTYSADPSTINWKYRGFEEDKTGTTALHVLIDDNASERKAAAMHATEFNGTISTVAILNHYDQGIVPDEMAGKHTEFDAWADHIERQLKITATPIGDGECSVISLTG